MQNVEENPDYFALSAGRVYAILTFNFAQYAIVDLYASITLVLMHIIAKMTHFEIFNNRNLTLRGPRKKVPSWRLD